MCPNTVRSGRGGFSQRRPLSWALRREGEEETRRRETGRQAWAPLVPCRGQTTGGDEIWQFPAPHGDFRCPGLAAVLFVTSQSARRGLARAVGVCWELCPLGAFPGGSAVKNKVTCSAGGSRDAGLIPGWGRSPGGGNGYPPQYSCLENPMDRGARRAT